MSPRNQRRKRAWLADLRGDRSQAEIAEELTRRGAKCSRPWYSLIELGLRDPTPELARAIANLYGITMEAVFFGPEGDELDRMWALADEFRARARRLRVNAREMQGTVTAHRMEAAAGAWDAAARLLAADNRLRAGWLVR